MRVKEDDDEGGGQHLFARMCLREFEVQGCKNCDIENNFLKNKMRTAGFQMSLGYEIF